MSLTAEQSVQHHPTEWLSHSRLKRSCTSYGLTVFRII